MRLPQREGNACDAMKPSILIVDDEKNTREGLRKALESPAYGILLAANSAEALG